MAGSSVAGCVGSGGIVIFGRYLSADRIIAGSGGSDTGDTMMMSLYFTLGVFLLIAVRNPAAHRSLIAFAAWSSFAHAVTMSIQGLEMPSMRTGFLAGSGVLVMIGVALIVLAPARKAVEETAAVGA